MTQIVNFNEILENIDALSSEDQAVLIDILLHRQVERRRGEIAVNIAQAKEEYQTGQIFRGTINELMDELNQ